MRRRILLTLTLTGALIAALAATPGTTASANGTATPSRVLLIVIDGMRADYLDRYDLPNLEALRASGVGFSQSQVGYMASITVISHNVIASGQLPKHQGWSNEIYRDVDNVLGGGAGALHVMSSASCNDFALLASHGGYPKLEDYLGTLETDGDARMLSIAQKDRSACGVGQPADASDAVVGIARLSTAITCAVGGGATETRRWRFPRGVNVPASMATQCSRFYVNDNEPYGTDTTSPALLYPLDGNRFVPGFDTTRLGGDVWTVDGAIQMMREDLADTGATDKDWRGLFVGIGGPDKMAHMWGPDDTVTGEAGSVDAMIHLPGELKTADEEVGKLLAELRAEGLDDETLVVVTADHGMTDAKSFYGAPTKTLDGGNFNWYYGTETVNRTGDTPESYLSPSPAIAKLAERIGDNLAFSYQDTQVAVWLKSGSKGERTAAAKQMRRLPGAIATYRLSPDMDSYVPVWVGPMTNDERDWFDDHAQTLIDTMASPDAADAVALLANDVTYSVQGDHGGHQPDNQFIPIFFSGPGVPTGVMSDEPIRNVDILPTILQHLGIAATAPMDGVAFDLRGAA
jgi:hypothetical protein